MSEEHEGGGKGRNYVAIFAAIVVIYFLSPAPVMKLMRQNPRLYLQCEPALERVYMPLNWLCQNVSPVAQFYVWYFMVWGF